MEAQLGRADKWYKCAPERVVENERFKASRPDIIFVDKQAREAKIMDMAIPGDAGVKTKN